LSVLANGLGQIVGHRRFPRFRQPSRASAKENGREGCVAPRGRWFTLVSRAVISRRCRPFRLSSFSYSDDHHALEEFFSPILRERKERT
jgi:hypothetical protein